MPTAEEAETIRAYVGLHQTRAAPVFDLDQKSACAGSSFRARSRLTTIIGRDMRGGTPMVRTVFAGLAAALLVGVAFIPDDALAYRGGGARAGGGVRAAGVRGGAVGVAGRGVGYGRVGYGARYGGVGYRGLGYGAGVAAAATGAAVAAGTGWGWGQPYYGGGWGAPGVGYYGGGWGYPGGGYANTSYVTGRPTLLPRYYGGGYGWGGGWGTGYAAGPVAQPYQASVYGQGWNYGGDAPG